MEFDGLDLLKECVAAPTFCLTAASKLFFHSNGEQIVY